MKFTLKLTTRLRFIMVVGATLIPLASIMAMVMVTTYFPLFRAMDNIVYESLEEIMPLVHLENALHRSMMPPNDYLIHERPQEIESWQHHSSEVDRLFTLSLVKVSFNEESEENEEAEALTALQEKWELRKSEGDAIMSSLGGRSAKELAMAMEEFDHGMYEIIDGIGRQHEKMYQFIQSEYRRASSIRNTALTTTLATLVMSVIIGFAASIYLTRDRNKLVEESTRDPLTGSYNRRALEAKLASLDGLSPPQSHSTYSLILLDIDHFKKVNDRYGHQKGDRVICHITRVVEQIMRDEDFFARWGGEEFVLLLPQTNKTTALTIAERIREAIASTPTITREHETIMATVSIGVGSFPDDGSKSSSIMAAADEALYQAKHGGRNCIMSLETRSISTLS